jgi:hypothetical protein
MGFGNLAPPDWTICSAGVKKILSPALEGSIDSTGEHLLPRTPS